MHGVPRKHWTEAPMRICFQVIDHLSICHIYANCVPWIFMTSGPLFSEQCHLPKFRSVEYKFLNTSRPIRNGQHFADDIFKRIFFNENVWISINISLTCAPKYPINNYPPLVQIMAWRRPGDKPLSEPMMASLPTYICVTRPQWVKPPNCPEVCHVIIIKETTASGWYAKLTPSEIHQFNGFICYRMPPNRVVCYLFYQTDSEFPC